MWAAAAIVISLSVVGVGSLLYLANERKHSRQLEAERKKAIDEAKQKLKEARRAHPDDTALHAALRDTLLRLQGRK
jgi:hypothetical protein